VPCPFRHSFSGTVLCLVTVGYLVGCKKLPPLTKLQGMITLVEAVSRIFAERVTAEWVQFSLYAKRTAGDRARKTNKRGYIMKFVQKLWCDQEGQDIAEYAVMLAVILVIVVGTVRLIGSNANNVFSNAASTLQ
jgi:Flp pilus assembly pilin Flp